MEEVGNRASMAELERVLSGGSSKSVLKPGAEDAEDVVSSGHSGKHEEQVQEEEDEYDTDEAGDAHLIETPLETPGEQAAGYGVNLQVPERDDDGDSGSEYSAHEDERRKSAVADVGEQARPQTPPQRLSAGSTGTSNDQTGMTPEAVEEMLSENRTSSSPRSFIAQQERSASPEPQTPVSPLTPREGHLSADSMASVSLSETDYEQLSPEQMDAFLATPRASVNSRHMRKPSSLEILQNSWAPARQSTLFDAQKTTPPLTPASPGDTDDEAMGARQSVHLASGEVVNKRSSSLVGTRTERSESAASSNATATRRSTSSDEYGNEVDWSQLERNEQQEKTDKEIPAGAEDDSTAFLLARLEQENAALTSDPKAATHNKSITRVRSKSRPPSMAQLKKLVSQNDAPSIRYSLASDMALPEEPPPMTELEFWAALVQDYPSAAARLPTLTTSKIRAGIPPPIRGVVWTSMAGARDRGLEESFERLLGEKSPYEGIINKDVGRSFPGVELFRDAEGEGQKMLGRVLKCFSLHDKDIGYCQGLGFLVGPLLMNMGERDAFCVLVRLMDHYSLQPSFLPSLSGLHMRIYQFSALLKQLHPDLSNHLTEMGVEPAYLSQWFLSCFAVTCPLPMLFRIYDVIFAEGANETVMRVALALIRRSEQTLLQSTEFEEVMQLLLGRAIWDSYGCNPDELVDDFTSLDDVITHARLAGLEKEFESQSNESVGERAGFLPDVQAAAGRFLGRLWAPSHSANKSTSTLTPPSTEKERTGFLRRSPSKQSISTLNESENSHGSGSTSLASTAPTDLDEHHVRESTADTMSLRSKAESTRTQSVYPQVSKEDRDLHSQIEDLLTALSEMQREHAQLAAMLQKEREDRGEDHRVVRMLVGRLRNGDDKSSTTTVEERRRTLPPPAKEQSHTRQLSQPTLTRPDEKKEVDELVNSVTERLDSSSRFSMSFETKAQLRSTLSRTREQLAAEENRSRDLTAQVQEHEATISAYQGEGEDLRAEVAELRTRVNEEFKDRQKLEHTVRELQAQARSVSRRERLARADSSNETPTLSRIDTSDGRRGSIVSMPTNSVGGLRELKLGRRDSSSSVSSTRPNMRPQSMLIRPSSPSPPTSALSQTQTPDSVAQPEVALPPPSSTEKAPEPAPAADKLAVPGPPNGMFHARTSSLATQAVLATPQHEPAAEEALLLELVNAKTAEAQARQEVDELRRASNIAKRKQDEALRLAQAELEIARAEAEALRAQEQARSKLQMLELERSRLQHDSQPGTPGAEDGGVSLARDTPTPPPSVVVEKNGGQKETPSAGGGGGWFWSRRTASTTQAKVQTP